MQKNLLSDSAFATHTIFFALLLWALLQGTVSTVHAAQTAPQPISFTATVGVGVENAIREDAVIITTDTGGMNMAEGFTRTKASSILQANIKKETYVCMSTTTPDENGNNFTEPAPSTGYTRRAFGDVDTSIPAQVANDDIIFLFEALADCGSFTHLGLSDSKSIGSGVFLMARLASAVTVTAGYVPLIRAHKLVVGLDKEALEAYA